MVRSRTPDPHGNAPDNCRVALLIIDAINDLEFPGGAAMLPRSMRMARKIAALKHRTSALGIPTIYVNDNFGRWRSDFRETIAHCGDERVRGHPITRLLLPDENDYFVLKPKHSGFYNTSLELLIDYLHAETLILTGIATDSCVLVTAADAYMRDLQVIIPRDCVTAVTTAGHRTALSQMRTTIKATVLASATLDTRRLKRLTRARSSTRARGAGVGESSGRE